MEKSEHMNLITGNLISLFLLGLVIILVLFDTMRNKSTRYFLYVLCIAAIESTLEIITVVDTANTLTSATVCRIANGLGFALAPFVGYYMLAIVISKTPYNRYLNMLRVPLIINVILSISSIWLGLIFIVTKDNIYSRGPLFSVQFFINFFYIFTYALLDYSNKKHYMLDDRICLSLNYILLVVGIFMQILHPNSLIIWASVSICLVFYYITSLNIKLRRDSLTCVFNRGMYQRAIEGLNRRSTITVIIIDINNFKTINDTHGHIFGDEVLTTAAKTIENHFIEYGYTYRIGGDEFSVLCKIPSITSIESIFNEIEEDLIPLKEIVNIPTLISYGYSQYNHTSFKDISNTIKEADFNMYENKRQAKGKIINF